MTLDAQRQYVGADPDNRKLVRVLGDPVFYGEPGVTAVDFDKKLSDGDSVVLEHGRTFISSGSSQIGVVDTDEKAQVSAPDGTAKTQEPDQATVDALSEDDEPKPKKAPAKKKPAAKK